MAVTVCMSESAGMGCSSRPQGQAAQLHVLVPAMPAGAHDSSASLNPFGGHGCSVAGSLHNWITRLPPIHACSCLYCGPCCADLLV